MSESNKAMARRVMEEAWSQGKLEVVDELISADCRLHDPVFPSLGPGTENLKGHISMCRSAFPDLRFTIDDVIAERNEVVIHWTGHCTHRGTFLGIPPTNREASVSGTSIYRIDGAKIVETWSDWNLLTLMEQLGVAAAPKAEVPVSPTEGSKS